MLLFEALERFGFLVETALFIEYRALLDKNTGEYTYVCMYIYIHIYVCIEYRAIYVCIEYRA